MKPVHLLIDSSGLSVHVGQWRTPPKARDYRKLHLAVDEQTSDVVACELTSKRARDASRVASLVGQIERPIASAKADAAIGESEPDGQTPASAETPKVTVVSMAWFEYWRCRPGFLRVGLGEFQLASLPAWCLAWRPGSLRASCAR